VAVRYLVRSGGAKGRTISRHRKLAPAIASLKRYINQRKTQRYTLRVFSAYAQRSMGYSPKYGAHLVPIRFSVIEDEDGREKIKGQPYAMVVKLVKG
jgi:hypothetical protein